mgnify:CR=1 FL=1
MTPRDRDALEDALIRYLEGIGEASKRLSDEPLNP